MEGKTKELTRGQLMNLAYSSDPKIRGQAYQEQFRVYAADGPILGQMYQTRVRDWHNENIGLRKFTTPNSARNLMNDIPDEAVDALLDVARTNAGVFQRFFQTKGETAGREEDPALRHLRAGGRLDPPVFLRGRPRRWC